MRSCGADMGREIGRIVKEERGRSPSLRRGSARLSPSIDALHATAVFMPEPTD